MNCPLCHCSNIPVFTVEKRPVRDYGHCPVCDMIAMDPRQHWSRAEEKARYDLHENESTEGYREFLRPLFEQIQNFCATLSRPAHILDFGCGPTAFFARWLEQEGLGPVAKYDLFYFTDTGSLQRDYDVIVSTEVWEHFHHPQEEIEQLVQLLKPGGLFAIATSSPPATPDIQSPPATPDIQSPPATPPQPISAFHDWYYRRDLTHVVFYSEKTMQWIAKRFGLQLQLAKSPYWIFKKSIAK